MHLCCYNEDLKCMYCFQAQDMQTAKYFLSYHAAAQQQGGHSGEGRRERQAKLGTITEGHRQHVH